MKRSLKEHQNVKNTLQWQLMKLMPNFKTEKKIYRKKLINLNFELSHVSHKWSKTQKDDILEDTESCHQQLQDL